MKLPETLKRAQTLFADAIQLPASARNEFIANSCGQDDELFATVQSLLAAYEQAGQGVQPPLDNQAEAATVPLAHVAPPPKKLIHHYEIQALIGRGGMGEVYKALDRKLGRTVAIKTLAPGLINNQVAQQRFFREAKAASRLSHPSICTVYEIGTHADVVFIAMQYIEGKTLSQALAQGKLPLETALAYALDIADALHTAHQNDIIHRDIKPSNVMINERDVAVVLDFGLAKQIHSETSAEANTGALDDVTTHLGIIGTVPYMSPEQVKSLALDARSDIFSFGTVCYEMLTGQRPFKGRNDLDTLHLILYEDPTPPHELNPQLDPELARIIQKTLAKEVSDRYQTLAEVKQDLIRFICNKQYAVRGVFMAASAANTTPLATTGQPQSATRPIGTAFQTMAARLPFLSRQTTRYALLILAGTLAILLVWWMSRATLSPAPERAVLKTAEIVNWSATPGEVYSLGSFSPDAKRIAYSSTESGIKSIWVKQTNAGSAVQITTDEFKNENPIWSPDGEEVAFLSLRGNHPGLWRIPYLGGTATEIKPLEIGEGDIYLRYWSKKNTLYYELKHNLFGFAIASRTTTQLTQFDAAQTNISQLNIAPDETKVTYVQTDENNNFQLKVIPSGGGTAKMIASHATELRNPVWHPDNQRVLYSVDVDGIYQIFAAHIDEQTPIQLTFGDKDAFVLDVATDGSKILYGSSKEESDLWAVDLTAGKEFAVAAEMGSELWPHVAPDAKAIAFQSIRNLSQGDKLFQGTILVQGTQPNANPVELSASGGLPQWSPDGAHIAFMQPANEMGLFAVRISGGTPQQLTSGLVPIENSVLPYNRVQTNYFHWSPDSQRLAYCSRKNGAVNIWTVQADGTNDQPITTNSDRNLVLSCPLWSTDGKYIAYTTKPNKVVDGKFDYAIALVDVQTKQTITAYQSEKFLRLLGWADNEKTLVLATTTGKTGTGSPTDVSIAAITLAQPQPRSIAQLSNAYLYNIQLAADGKNLAFVAHQDGKDNIWTLATNGGTARKVTANNDGRLYFSSLAWAPDGKTIFFGKQSRFSLLSLLSNFK